MAAPSTAPTASSSRRRSSITTSPSCTEAAAMPDRLRAWCQRLVVRPLIRGYCGLRVSHGERLPRTGPAILVANHNSHFDTLALFALFSPRETARLHAVAAGDYFCPGSLR